MCGIAGAISFENVRLDRDEMASFVYPLRFRGPDHEQHVVLENEPAFVWMAHSRLSIIDLSDMGNQPMFSASDRIVIVFNGEIYNYKELRQELIFEQCTFKTNSDTEVILAAYETWGIEKTLARLDGMFAFALYDTTRKALYLVRDRFGKKPLYYRHHQESLFFSSDIRSFKAIRALPLTLDPYAAGYYFSELSTPEEHSIWKEVKKLNPASYLKFTKSGVEPCKQFWRLNYTGTCRLSHEDATRYADELLTNAVKKRLVADVNVGAMLSGGMDSSLVVAKMATLSTMPVKTYAVGFVENEFNESNYAEYVAQKFGTVHSSLQITASDIGSINDLIMEFGEPFADSSMIPSHLISKAISKTEKVVVGGDGGDELFAGYHSYYFAYKYEQVKKFGWLYPASILLSKLVPTYRTTFLKELLKQTKLPPSYLLNRSFSFSPEELAVLVHGERSITSAREVEHARVWKENSTVADSELLRVLAGSLKTRLLNDYLVKIDRASMFASLEMRSPFLDRDLAEFASSLTPSQLYLNGPKSILKSMAGKYFTPGFIHRKKMGFSLPIREWLRSDWREMALDAILGGKQNLINMNYKFVENMFREHVEGTRDHTHKLWSLYVFHVWAHRQ